MTGKVSVIFFGLESVGEISTIYMAAINSGSFGTAEHSQKAWKLGIICAPGRVG